MFTRTLPPGWGIDTAPDDDKAGARASVLTLRDRRLALAVEADRKGEREALKAAGIVTHTVPTVNAAMRRQRANRAFARHSLRLLPPTPQFTVWAGELWRACFTAARAENPTPSYARALAEGRIPIDQ